MDNLDMAHSLNYNGSYPLRQEAGFVGAINDRAAQNGPKRSRSKNV